jgi:uncharacterized protein YbjT (DUF2867 family)
MHIILGGTGHVGAALAGQLLDQGEKITIVSRNVQKAASWQAKGATIAIVDVRDSKALAEVFRSGKSLFLLNPPAAPSTDTAREERQTLACILRALDGSGMEKVVAQSTYGAQPGERLGDLGVLYEMEQALASKPISTTIIRAAYYMSNWEMSLESARKEGKVYSFFPPHLKLPMVSPEDIGRVAARLLTAKDEKGGLHYVEGPTAYTSIEVAQAFSAALHTSVEAVQIPVEQWIPAMQSMGFSPEAAQSMAAMTKVVVEKNYEQPAAPFRGSTTLQQYIFNLVEKQQETQK